MQIHLTPLHGHDLATDASAGMVGKDDHRFNFAGQIMEEQAKFVLFKESAPHVINLDGWLYRSVRPAEKHGAEPRGRFSHWPERALPLTDQP